MKYFHGKGRRHSYFEGWYCKHNWGGNTLALIPAYHVSPLGRPTASLQVVTPQGARSFDFPAKDFWAAENRFHVRMGDCEFSQQGCKLSLHQGDFHLEGQLEYSPFTPLKGDIMGPFRYLPMECSHGVISLHHHVAGKLSLNGSEQILDGGDGYIETDRGTSFPRQYLWAQCSWSGDSPNGLMISVAEIPFGGRSFTGCIASVLYRGKQYRLATYYGARVHHWGPDGAALRQGPMLLEVKPLVQGGHALLAPVRGNMQRHIKEQPACPVRCKLYLHNRLLFDQICDCSGFEYAAPAENL